MRVLITGHKGFIGGHLWKEISQDRHFILEGFDLKDDQNIEDESQVSKAFRTFRPDIVLHQAALNGVTQSFNYPVEYWKTNILGFANILKECENHNCKLVYALSASGIEPIQSPYGMTKAVNYRMAQMSRARSIGLIYYNVYGLNQPYGAAIPRFISDKTITIYGDGQSLRSFTYVSDIVRANMMAMVYQGKETCFHVGAKSISVLEAARLFKKEIVHTLGRQGEKADSICSEPQLFNDYWSLSEGLKDMGVL